MKISLLDIADTPEKQAWGLQFVRHVPENTGMLFRFNYPHVLSFWMLNTYVGLDIAFIDKDNVIVKTERMIPLSTRSVTSGRPCMMALEVPGGTFKDVVGKMVKIDLNSKLVTIDD
jgi:hypothetical protein